MGHRRNSNPPVQCRVLAQLVEVGPHTWRGARGVPTRRQVGVLCGAVYCCLPGGNTAMAAGGELELGIAIIECGMYTVSVPKKEPVPPAMSVT